MVEQKSFMIARDTIIITSEIQFMEKEDTANRVIKADFMCIISYCF